MNPLDFHKVADYLVRQDGAAELRSAISRAYYGTFLYCCKKINELGFNLPRDATAHTQVSQYLNNCGDLKLQSVASQLSDLRHTRNLADYFLTCEKVEKPDNARANVQQAKKMVQIVKDRFDKNSTDIASKIEEYRKRITGLTE